jgi:hypothetical protein
VAALAWRCFEWEWSMKRFFLVVCTLGLLSSSVWAAQPIVLQARTAGDLAALCAADSSAPGADAKINFCHGFAQGAVDGRLYVSGDKKPFCLTAGTRRADTMREFVAWARAVPANRDMPVLDGLFKFFGERFPCK